MNAHTHTTHKFFISLLLLLVGASVTRGDDPGTIITRAPLEAHPDDGKCFLFLFFRVFYVPDCFPVVLLGVLVLFFVFFLSLTAASLRFSPCHATGRQVEVVEHRQHEIQRHSNIP